MLLLKRRSDQHCGDLWSFPGGKIEVGESPQAAAARELLEETGIIGQRWQPLGQFDHPYPDRLLSFYIYRCQCADGVQITAESPFTWVPFSHLNQFAMPEANQQILRHIQQL